MTQNKFEPVQKTSKKCPQKCNYDMIILQSRHRPKKVKSYEIRATKTSAYQAVKLEPLSLVPIVIDSQIKSYPETNYPCQEKELYIGNKFNAENVERIVK